MLLPGARLHFIDCTIEATQSLFFKLDYLSADSTNFKYKSLLVFPENVEVVCTGCKFEGQGIDALIGAKFSNCTFQA